MDRAVAWGRTLLRLCAKYDVLNLHIGHVQTSITSSLSVSHAAAPSVRLDFVLKCLNNHMQTIRRLATGRFARQAYTNSHGVKRQPGKGKDNSRMLFLSIFGLVCLCIRLGVK